MAADESLASPGRRYATALGAVAAAYERGGALAARPTSMLQVQDPDCPACLPTAQRLLRAAAAA
jgi:hypothetical protein